MYKVQLTLLVRGQNPICKTTTVLFLTFDCSVKTETPCFFYLINIVQNPVNPECTLAYSVSSTRD